MAKMQWHEAPPPSLPMYAAALCTSRLQALMRECDIFSPNLSEAESMVGQGGSPRHLAQQ